MRLPSGATSGPGQHEGSDPSPKAWHHLDEGADNKFPCYGQGHGAQEGKHTGTELRAWQVCLSVNSNGYNYYKLSY